MASVSLYYLLGAWLLLGQFPKETTADSLKHMSRSICHILQNHFENTCKKKMQRDLNVHEEVTLQEGPLSEVPIIFRYRDVEDLKTLSEFHPEFPQELKAALSDSWSLLRKLQHPKDRDIFLKLVTKLCCFFKCLSKIKNILCGKYGID